MERKIYVAQDNYEFSLMNLVMEKRQRKESFAEEYILSILNKITQAIIWMHDNEFKNVPLDAEAVFFVKDLNNLN